MNKVILSGNICKDIEVKYYSDKKYIKNTIAVRRGYKNKENENTTDFISFAVWGNQAEYLENYASKGTKILICGRFTNNNYERDGQMIYSDEIQVENVEILSRKEEENRKENANDEFEISGDDYFN